MACAARAGSAAPDITPTTARWSRCGIHRCPASPAVCRRRSSRGDTIAPSQASRSSGPPAAIVHGRASAPPARVIACIGQRCEQCDGAASGTSPARRSRPGPSPTRFMPSFQSPVPISGRPAPPSARPGRARARSVRTAWRSRPRAMGWKKRRARPRAARPSRNGTISSSTAASPVTSHVVGGGEGQPDAIVGDARAHALAGMRQPPVLHVALR